MGNISLKTVLYHFIILAVVCVVAPFLSPYNLKLATEAILLSVFAMSFDLVMGYAGIVTFGHAAFFGIGGYTLGVIVKFLFPSVWLALIIAGIISALLAFFIGSVSIRAKGVYFAIMTLAFAEIVYRIIYHAYDSPLGGSDGLRGIPTPHLNLGVFNLNLAKPLNFYYMAVVFAYLSYLVCSRIVSSPFGHVLQGIRENDNRIPFIGFNIKRFKVLAFVLSGIFAGLSGAMFSLFKGYADTEQLGFLLSGKVIVMDLIGGIGTLIGPMFGAIFITVVESIISTYFEAHSIIVGALFVIVVLFLPKGLLGLIYKNNKENLRG